MRLGRLVLAAFGFGSVLFLAATVLSYLGLGDGGSPRLTARELVRVQQVGLYSQGPQPGVPFLRLSGGEIDGRVPGFVVPGLRKGQDVFLTGVSKGVSLTWVASVSPMETPVRLGDKCINAIPGGWIDQASTYAFTFRPESNQPRRYFAVKVGPGNEFTYSQGTIEGGTRKADAPPVTIRQNLREGMRLSSLLGGTASLQSAWTHPTPLLLTQGGPGVTAWEIASGVTVVRERKGDVGSRLGVLIDPALVERGVVFTREVGGKEEGFQPSLTPTSKVAVDVEEPELTIGFSGSRQFTLQLPKGLNDQGRLVARFDVPISYPLPPPRQGIEPPFLLTSGRDMVPLDGYVFQTGNPAHPFYAKALVNRDYRSLSVQDGASRRQFTDDQPILLGDETQGVVLRLHVNKPIVPGAGRLALLALGLGTSVFLASLYWRPRGLQAADVAWVALWVAATALVVVRLLVSYRVSLVPPDDASASELAGFHKALRVSLDALFAVPLVLAMVRVRWLSKRQSLQLDPLRQQWAKLDHSRVCLWLAGLAAIVPVLARLTGSRNDLLGVRTSIWVHLLIVAALWSFSVAAGRPREERTKFSLFHPRGLLAFAGLCWLALVLLVLAIGDNGTVLYACSIGLALLVAWVPFRANRGRASSKVPAGVAFTMAVVTVGALALIANRTAFLQRYERLSGTVGYRLATLDDLEPELLLNPRRTDYVEVQQVRNNREQEWQMLLYASVGASKDNPGYGRLPLSKVGIKYPTTLTDTAYAVYILGEFGPWAGTWLTGLYLAIMAACFAGVSLAFRQRSWSAIPLVAVGAYFATNGIYMAASNVATVPFTGQNLPLLALYSQGDALQGLLLLALASVLLRKQVAATVPPSRNWSFRAVPVYGGLMGALWLLAARAAIAMSPELARDHDNPDVIRAVAKRVEAKQVKVNDQLQIEEAKIPDLSPIEREASRDFNLRPNKLDASAGLYYLERNARNGFDLRVNPSYFFIPSPYRRGQGVPWRASILSAKAVSEGPRLYMLSSPLSLSLDSRGYPSVVYIDSEEPIRRANAAILAARSARGRIEFAEYRRIATGVTLRPKQAPQGLRWRVAVEGETLSPAGRTLQPNDIVTLEDNTSRPSRRYNLVYLGDQPEPIAFVRWRNGTYRRVLPGGATFGLAEPLGRAGDETQTKGDLRLTLDLALHARLQREIRSWALGIRGRPDLGYQLEDPLRTKDVSMTILDTHSGAVLALPSFPHVDPTSSDYQDEYDGSGPVRRRKMLTNWNFENHVIGSTIKPLTFSAVASGLLGKIKLESLVVHARTLEHDEIGAVPLEKPTGAYRPLGDLEMGPYLTYSYTWPAVITAALGLVESPAELNRTLIPARQSPDLTLGGRDYKLNLLKTPNRVFSQDPQTGRWTLRTNLSETVLFRSLGELYDVETPASAPRPAEALRRDARSFLPTFEPQQRPVTFLDDVLPRRVIYDANSMRSVRQELVTTFIGGAQSLWNNVRMAEAFARLSTGKKIRAHLDARATPGTEPMPKPISDADWREHNLIAPLEKVHQIGTARGISPDWKGYRAVMKTGTLGESVDSESLMFTVGRWEKGGFVTGESITGYLFMRDTNNGGNFMKFGLANRLFPILVDYLQTQRASSRSD